MPASRQLHQEPVLPLSDFRRGGHALEDVWQDPITAASRHRTAVAQALEALPKNLVTFGDF